MTRWAKSSLGLGRAPGACYERRYMGLARRIVTRLKRELFVRVGRDPVTGLAIGKRPDLEVFGNRGAEWTVPTSLLDKDAIVYCVGCGEDISFDLALIARFGCTVYGLDPTPRSIAFVARVAGSEPRYRFFPVGLWKEQARMRFFAPQDQRHVSHSLLNVQGTSEFFEADVLRLRDFQTQEGHPHVHLLKLDIEGAEYEVLRTVIDDRLLPTILCVEFDEYFHPLDEGYRDRIRSALLELLGLGYELVFTGGNANYTLVRTGA